MLCTMSRTWPRNISNSRKLGFVHAVSSEERARTKKVAVANYQAGLLKKMARKKKKKMRGRIRELCRETNDLQNWFANIMRTRRVVSPALFYPRIFYIYKREFCMRKGMERQRFLFLFPEYVNSSSQFSVSFVRHGCVEYTKVHSFVTYDKVMQNEVIAIEYGLVLMVYLLCVW